MALETSPESPAPVRQIANAVAGWIDRLGAVWVEGQITQINRRQGLATVFMTLRDPVADLSVPLTCSRAVFDAMPPVIEGAGVVVHAKPSYYAGRGSFSLQVREIRMLGLGELLARLERRRQLLSAEGLFATELKRPLPFLPTRIGLITAPGSAAERDVVEHVLRRWPGAQLAVVHATMQGPRAAAENIAALQRLDADPDVSVIVITRGGGSVEDLLPFSDEALVRAVHAATTPVVSAIGHEPDTPLLDLVADVRASTPTDAARRVVPDMAEESQRIVAARDRARRLTSDWLHQQQAALDSLRSRPALADPHQLLESRYAEVMNLRERGRRTVSHRLDRGHDEIAHHAARARALSPLATLKRGYAVLLDPAGHVVSATAAVAEGDRIAVRVADGRVHAIVDHTETHDLPEEPDE